MHAAPANRIITTAAIPAIHAISLVLLSFSNQNAPHSGRIALLLFPEWILLIKIFFLVPVVIKFVNFATIISDKIQN